MKAAQRAFGWRRMLQAGRFATINELAAAEKINSSYVSRVLRLTLLAPDIVEAILDGRQPAELDMAALMGGCPSCWHAQLIGFASYRRARSPVNFVGSSFDQDRPA